MIWPSKWRGFHPREDMLGAPRARSQSTKLQYAICTGKEQAAPRSRITANSYSANPDLPFMVRNESDDSLATRKLPTKKGVLGSVQRKAISALQGIRILGE